MRTPNLHKSCLDTITPTTRVLLHRKPPSWTSAPIAMLKAEVSRPVSPLFYRHHRCSRSSPPLLSSEEYIGYVRHGETEPVVVSTGEQYVNTITAVPLTLSTRTIPVPERGQPSTAPVTPIDLTKDAEDGFGALRAALGAVCAGSAENKVRLQPFLKISPYRIRVQETIAIRKEIENLLPRVVTLGELFQTLPHDIEDQRHRQELIEYDTAFRRGSALTSL